MANKVPWYIHWDWKSIWGSLAVVLIILGVVAWIQFPKIIRNIKLRNLEGETVGYIVTLKENDMIRYSLEGSKNIVDSYLVSYQYNANGQLFSGSDLIDGSNENYIALKKTMDNERKIVVKFDLRRPVHSMIDLNP